jgi:hypothetical protein
MSVAAPVTAESTAEKAPLPHQEDEGKLATHPSSSMRDEEAHSAIDQEHEDLVMTKEEERTILRKIDLNIIPYCSLLYLLSFLDRVNIGQAAVAGLKTDLHMVTGNAYQIALSVFVSGRRHCADLLLFMPPLTP